MPEIKFNYEIELRRTKGQEFLCRAKIDRARFQPLADETIWQARRRGVLDPNSSHSRSSMEPVFRNESSSGKARSPGRAVERVRVHVGGVTREFELEPILREVVRDELRVLVQARRLAPSDEYEVSFLASPMQDGAEVPSLAAGAGPHLEAVVEQAPLLFAEGNSGDLEARSELLNPDAHDEIDTAVFIQEEAYDQVLRFCRSGGKHESGAMLVGRLFRQTNPSHDIFVVIEAAFEARHADQKAFSLELTTQTYVHIERQLERRRKRLGRPEEFLVGEAHGHPFLPALDADGNPLCPGCEKRPTCDLHSAFFSPEDVQFHTSLFRSRVFAIGMVWGLSPRQEDVLRVYGFRGGVLAERSLWLVH